MAMDLAALFLAHSRHYLGTEYPATLRAAGRRAARPPRAHPPQPRTGGPVRLSRDPLLRCPNRRQHCPRRVESHVVRLSWLASAAATLCAACGVRPGIPASRDIPVSTSSRPAEGRTLVAVVAHPDDETIVSPVLARYAREGARAYLVVATDGRRGVAKHAGIPAGDSLATVRAGETRCSARELGIQPPILLGLEDAGLAVISPWPGEPLDRLAKRLEATLRELRPDAVITWGPEGGYGHADHRLVGDVVTQLFQAGAVAPPARLYFAGFTADRVASSPPWFGFHLYPTAPALLTAVVRFDERDRAAARRALSCHRSQATAADMDESFAALEHLWQGQVTFQQWRGGTPSSGLF
jgi:LmbE family N-acetylglucosaminyl deacetylase